jgi:hypothetical protein
MSDHHLRPSVLIAVALLGAATPAYAQGGLLKRVKDTAKQRAATAAAQAATAVVQKSGDVTDSTLQPGVAVVDSAAGRATGAVSSLVGRVQGRLPGAIGGRERTSAPESAAPRSASAAAREGGATLERVPLTGVVFVGPDDALAPAATAYLREVVRGLATSAATWTVTAVVPPAGDTTRDQARAARRAAAVKAVLVAAGLPAARLTTAGRVAAGAPSDAATGVELVRQP